MQDEIEALQRAVDRGFADGNKTIVADIEVMFALFEQVGMLREALLPFSASASRPGRLLNSMSDEPLDDEAVLGLGVRVKDWKRAIELTKA